MRCYTAEMFYLILRYPKNLDESTTGNQLIDSIVKYINQNYMSDIKLSTVAKMKSVSQEHISRTFKSCTGFGFNEYVTLLRLRKAEEMIKTEPDKTISEIAYECGFNDGNYFSYKFKKMYGVSPIKLRSKK
jgi:YesN/AraC family two-component response regulator